MRTRTRGQPRPYAAIAASLALGVIIGWWLHATGGPRPSMISVFEPAGPAYGGAGAGERSRAPTSPTIPPKPAPPGAPAIGEAPIIGGASTRAVDPPVIAAAPPGTEPGGAIDMLRQRRLRVPIDGISAESFKGQFAQHRSGEGGHPHEAVDILSPRNTPVHAVEDGTIAKLFESRAGGHTIYQFDTAERFAYYYAHLERYASGLHDGQHVNSGDVIGYVGTSGNAPPG